jgi:hypothetical protein
MRNTTRLLCVASAAAAAGIATLVAGSDADAASITYTITDIGTFAGYSDGTQTDTFSGTGFVGIYPDGGGNGPSGAFVHLFGLENYGSVYSETELEVDISALDGQHITSATLSYVIANGDGGAATISATSYSANGTLSYNNVPPNDLGSVSYTSNQLSSNSVDVTSLLQSQATANATWFGLFLVPTTDSNQWTYTYSGFGDNSDSADVRLTVVYGVPEPSTWAMMLVGFVGLGFAGYRVSRKALSLAE